MALRDWRDFLILKYKGVFRAQNLAGCEFPVAFMVEGRYITPPFAMRQAGLAQLVEQLICNQ